MAKTGYSRSFDEGISNLMDELRLAIQWSRPSILLAVHKSKWGQVKAERALTRQIEKENKRVVQLQITTVDGNIPRQIQQRPDYKDTVFFISRLDENKSAYSILNLQREFFVEESIRAVFWLTEKESTSLPRLAPDFWAFRHRVVEFAPTRNSKKSPLAPGILLWNDFNGYQEIATLLDKIRAYENSISHLSENEALSLRLGSISALIHLYSLLEDRQKMDQIMEQGSQITRSSPRSPESLWFQNARAIVAYRSGNLKKSLQIYQDTLNTHTANSVLMINLCVVLHALGKNMSALKQAQQAAKQEPANAQIWHVLGCIDLSVGYIEKALECFEKARGLDKHNEDYPFAIAVGYYTSGQVEKCREYIKDNIRATNPLQRAWKDLMFGEEKQAHHGLKTAIQQNRLNKVQVLDDVYLHFLLGKVQVELFDQ